jgi:myo-inositol-1(or 4)-monophosphatase
MFVAEKGGGAWMNESRVRVSGRRSLIEGVFACSVPHSGRPGLPDKLQEFARVMPAVAAVRTWGSAALNLAYVAAGRFDGYWDQRLQPWDVAAGLLICREAGALAEPIHAGRSIVDKGEIIVANEALFDGFAKLVRG